MWRVCLLVLLARSDARVNYCGAKMCGHSNAHTFCQYRDGPGSQCTGYMEAPLSMDDKARVLARLNQRRSAAASGHLRGLPSAGNMLKLRWVDELERGAQRWADQCQPQAMPENHDECRDLYSVTVGQCVASVVGESPGLRPESMVDIWYMQSMHYKGNVTNYEAPQKSSSYYGDFAQLVWAYAYMVGCGRSRFMSLSNGRYRSVERLVCNFGPRGPAVGRPLWTMASPATACPPYSAPDKHLTALCDYQYNMADNDSQDTENAMSLEERLLLNTILNIESNQTMNYLGSIDEMYLTNLAIVTMDFTKPTTPTTFNKTEGNKDTNSTEIDNTNASELKKNNTGNDTNKGKINFVGRPKSYHMNELTDLENDHITKNHVEVPEQKLPFVETDTYGDYEYSNFEDTDKETKTLSISSTTDDTLTVLSITVQDEFKATTVPEFDVKNSTMDRDNQNINRDVVNETQTNMTQYSFSNDYTLKGMDITTDNSSYEIIDDNKLDEYLSDPETVRRIQEELERMDMELAVQQSSPIQSGKVRRELRKIPNSKMIEHNQQDKPKTYQDQNFGQQIESNAISQDDSPYTLRHIRRQYADEPIYTVTAFNTQNATVRDKRNIDSTIQNVLPTEPAVIKMVMDYLPYINKLAPTKKNKSASITRNNRVIILFIVNALSLITLL